METEMEAKEENRGVHSDEDGEDPCKIQIELDMLNSASESINKLETELEKARSKFQKTKTEASTQLNQLLKKTGKRFVVSAQPFYKLSKQLQEEQLEAQKAAAKYQVAFDAYMSARNEVSKAEQRMTVAENAIVMTIDSICQEILNKTTMTLLDAEKEKIRCEQEHHLKTLQCAEYQKQMTQLSKDKGQAIQKAKPFYEMRDVLEKRLKVEKQNAEDLQLALVCNKQKYKHALSNLEQMSEEVHARRKLKVALPPRTPGVGAETESEMSDLPSSHFDMFSDSASQDSLEFCDDREFSDSQRHGCSISTVDEWEAPTQFVQSEDDKLTFDRPTKGAEVNGRKESSEDDKLTFDRPTKGAEVNGRTESSEDDKLTFDQPTKGAEVNGRTESSEDDKLTFDQPTKGAEVKGRTESNDLCRDDVLEGAETVSEASVIESVAGRESTGRESMGRESTGRESGRESTGRESGRESTGRESGRESSADNFANASTEGLAKSSGTKAPDGLESASSVAQKRTMAVKDLSKGIYVASASNPKTENPANDSQSGQSTTDGTKKNKILLQFPLLQSLVGRSNASSSHQNA